MTRKIARLGVAIVAVGAALVFTGGVASAHHAVFNFEATGDLVPDGPGDPSGSATGVVDFDSDESPDVCIDASSEGLDAIISVTIIAKADSSVLLDFGFELDTCVEATDEQREALHDTADDYLVLIATDEYEDGAVAGELIEEEPTTTTSSTPPTSESTTTTAAAVAAATTPRFTG